MTNVVEPMDRLCEWAAKAQPQDLIDAEVHGGGVKVRFSGGGSCSIGHGMFALLCMVVLAPARDEICKRIAESESEDSA